MYSEFLLVSKSSKCTFSTCTTYLTVLITEGCRSNYSDSGLWKRVLTFNLPNTMLSMCLLNVTSLLTFSLTLLCQEYSLCKSCLESKVSLYQANVARKNGNFALLRLKCYL